MRRAGWFVVILAMLLVAAGAAWYGGTRVRSPEQAAAGAAPPPRSVLTVPVELRVLSSELVTRGDVRPEVAVEVAGPAPIGGGQAVVTAVAVAAGDVVDEVTPVVEVSGRPVFVMEGDAPVFRQLGPGTTGRDVAQLQAGLAAGGCDVGESGVFDETTKACVVELYERFGYTPVRASDSEEADLAAAREAVADAADGVEDAEAALATAAAGPTELQLLEARQAVTAADNAASAAVAAAETTEIDAVSAVDTAIRTLNAALVEADPDRDDDAGGDSGGGGSSSGVGARVDAGAAITDALRGVDRARREGRLEVEHAEAVHQRAEAALAALEADPVTVDEQRALDQAHQRLRRAEADLEVLQAASGPVVRLGEIVFVPSLPARVDSLNAVAGRPVGGTEDNGGLGGGALLVLSSAGLVVAAEVPAGDVGLVAVGATADLLDETSGTVVTAPVRSIGPVRASSTGGGIAAEVLLVSDDVPAEWSGRNVRVTFTAAATEHPVLVVPQIAVSSGADGVERVEVLGADGVIRDVAVRAGLSADGFVEVTAITAGELNEADKVVTSQ